MLKHRAIFALKADNEPIYIASLDEHYQPLPAYSVNWCGIQLFICMTEDTINWTMDSNPQVQLIRWSSDRFTIVKPDGIESIFS